jgi:hypothetical protein
MTTAERQAARRKRTIDAIDRSIGTLRATIEHIESIGITRQNRLTIITALELVSQDLQDVNVKKVTSQK